MDVNAFQATIVTLRTATGREGEGTERQGRGATLYEGGFVCLWWSGAVSMTAWTQYRAVVMD